MEGATRVSNGRSASTLHFRPDRRAVDRLGVAVSRAHVMPEQFQALASGRAITLIARADPRVRYRFPTEGLSTEWRRVLAACRLSAAAGEKAWRATEAA